MSGELTPNDRRFEDDEGFPLRPLSEVIDDIDDVLAELDEQLGGEVEDDSWDEDA